MRVDDYKYWVSFRHSNFRRIKRYKTVAGVIKALERYSKDEYNSSIAQEIIVYKQIAQYDNNGLDKVLLLKELEKETAGK